jgi:putative nucleotidyltransferase with HDIG domain
VAPVTDTIDPKVLAKFYPLNALTRDEVELLAEQIPVLKAWRGKILVECGASDKKALYLLSGKLELTAGDGHVFIIEENTPHANNPISHLDPHLYTVKALTTVTFIRVDNQVINNLLEEENRFGERVENLYINEDVMNNHLFQNLYEDLVDDRLIIPTLPQVAIKIREVMNDDADIRKVEAVIRTDPSIAAAVMKVANSALYRTSQPVKTIEKAIIKIGLKMVKNLVFTYALKDMFRSQHPYINQRLKTMWTHSAEVAAVCFVLAGKLRSFDPEYALLLGLLHDIGMLPVLAYAERHPEVADTPEQIDTTIEQLHGEVGAIILTAWHFENEFAVVAREADDWFRDHNPQADYCDLVLIAQLHTFIGKSKEKIQTLTGKRSLPTLASVPAFHKLGLRFDGISESIDLLADANRQLLEAKQLLSL